MNWGRTPPNWQCWWKFVYRRPAGSDSSKVFACQGMRNIRQRPPGCYECVATIFHSELTMTWCLYRLHTIPRLLRELLLTSKWLLVIIVLLAESNKQEQQLVLIGTKVVAVILTLFQGHASSHVFVATYATKATLVVATNVYFGAICWSEAKINAPQVICPKIVHGVIGSCDSSCHQEAATTILLHIYASAKHSHAMNAEGPSSNKYATSSPNVLVILQWSRILYATWTQGMCHIHLSFLPSCFVPVEEQ